MAKKIISVMLSVCLIISSVSAFAYSDCNNEAVDVLTKLEVLAGYEDGTFRPNGLISRAEFTKIISSVTGGTKSDNYPLYESDFADVAKSHWAFKYILHCKALKLVDGYEDGTFRPDDNITLAETIKICLSAIGYNNLITEQSSDWSKPWIDMAYEYKLIDSKDKNSDSMVTRLEVAELVFKTINLPLCILTRYDTTNPTFDFADGTDDENGRKKPFRTLMTTYLQ